MSIFNARTQTKKRLGLMGKKKFKKVSYKRYLLTNRWKKKRNLVRKRDKVCTKCGSNIILQVNHKTYFRVGDELLSDLELLCESCHKKYHNL